MTKFYKEARVEDELPKEETMYNTDRGPLHYREGNWYNPLTTARIATPNWYFQEFSLQEVMVEFAVKKYTDEFQVSKERLHSIIEECGQEVTEFLKLKGYIQK